MKHFRIWHAGVFIFCLSFQACGGVNLADGLSLGGGSEEINCPSPVGQIVTENCSELLENHPGPSLAGSEGSQASREAKKLNQEINRDRARSCEAYNSCKLLLSDYQTEQRVLDDFQTRMAILDPVIADGKERRALAELKMLRDSYKVHPALRKYLSSQKSQAQPDKEPGQKQELAGASDKSITASASTAPPPERDTDMGPTPACRPHIVYFMEQLTQRFASTYYAVTPLTCARVKSGGSKMFKVDLSKGKCHKIIGTSNEGTDLDIIVSGVIEDTKSDNYPIVEFCLTGNFEITAHLTGGDGDLGIQVYSTDEIPLSRQSEQ